MRLLSFLAAVLLLLAQTTPAQAWNARGHMTVAAIAWSKMSTKARARAAALLKLNPRYPAWTQGVPRNRQALVAFVRAATWPDEIRGMVCASGPECYRDDGYTPADADSDLEIGYADKRLRRYWHFKDLPFSDDGTALKQPFAANAETRIVATSASLASPRLSDEAKSYDLAWLLHLVGDVHQPLHATSRFSRQLPQGDNGGNAEFVCLPAPAICETAGPTALRLHGLWDAALGSNDDPASAIRTAHRLLTLSARRGHPLAKTLSRTNLGVPPAAWLQESYRLARTYAYAAPVGDGTGPFRMTATYLADLHAIGDRQILIAGERLARMLDHAFAAERRRS